MSKSLKRVRAALEAAGLDCPVMECTAETRTAEQAAAAAGCALDQIVKSIVFRGADSGHVVLFLTAGGNRVDPAKASAAAGHELGRADAALVRAEAPVGHLSPVRCVLDPRLTGFDRVWAAAGTPRHIFAIAPADLHRLTGAEIVDFTA